MSTQTRLLTLALCVAFSSAFAEPTPKAKQAGHGKDTVAAKQGVPPEKTVTFAMQAVGDFSRFRCPANDPCAKPNACTPDEDYPCSAPTACTTVIGRLFKADNTEITDSVAVSLNADFSTAIVTYRAAKSDSPPMYLLLGCSAPHIMPAAGPPYKLTSLDPDVTDQRVTLTGDFSSVLAYSAPGKCSTLGGTGYVAGADGSGSRPIMVSCLTKDLVEISFTAGSSFHPTRLVLRGQPFPYTVAPPLVTQDAVYLADGLAEMCVVDPENPRYKGPQTNTSTDGGVTTTTDVRRDDQDKSKLISVTITKTEQKDNETETLSQVTLNTCDALTLTGTFPSTADSIRLRSVEGDHLFVDVRTREASLPAVINLQAPGGQSMLARLVTHPDSEQALLAVDMNIMDQETARRNFGARIAEKYVAVNLDLANRSEKKLQFNKSAIWFDVDYLESSGKYKLTFNNKLAHVTLDAVPYNVYDSPLATTGCRDFDNDGSPKEYRACRFYRYGIDQNQRVFPDDYQAMLNSFDYVTERSDRLLGYVELAGSVLTTISTGGIIAQVHNTAFKDAISVLTATFLPGFRALTMDTAHINRQRANLVNTTFQDTVLLPPRGHASTVVLLAREGKLDMAGYETPVVIDRVLNVHIDPDVLNGVKDANVPQGKVQVGYTREQVRQAIGEPDTSETTKDGTTTFTYSTGPYSEVKFDKQGLVTGSTPRDLPQQVLAAPTLKDAQLIVSEHGQIARTLTLLNGNSIIVGLESDEKTVAEFTNAGNAVAGGYTLLYDQISALKGKKQSEIEAALGKMKLPSAVTKYDPDVAPKKGAKDLVVTYKMPDVKDGTILITFSTLPSDKSGVSSKIEFGGIKP